MTNWIPGTYRADRATRLRRYWCPECRCGVVMAAWADAPWCGVVEDAAGVPDEIGGVGRVAHAPVRMLALERHHGGPFDDEPPQDDEDRPKPPGPDC